MSRLHDEEFNDRLEVQAFVELERQRATIAAQAERIRELEEAVSVGQDFADMMDSAIGYDGARIKQLEQRIAALTAARDIDAARRSELADKVDNMESSDATIRIIEEVVDYLRGSWVGANPSALPAEATLPTNKDSIAQ